jgi:hypothetical protein
MAAAYLSWHALACFQPWIGTLTRFGRILFAFALALTIGVFWEFAELASDADCAAATQSSAVFGAKGSLVKARTDLCCISVSIVGFKTSITEGLLP